LEGEDVFVPRGLPGTIMVSERFRDIRIEHAMHRPPVVLGRDAV
jgi:hypothetical protein